MSDDTEQIFKIKSRKSKNIRKRPQTDLNDEEDETVLIQSNANKRERNHDPLNPNSQGTSKRSSALKEEMLDYIKDADAEKIATVLEEGVDLSIETELSRDSHALLEKKIAASENPEAASSGSTYQGNASYANYVKGKESYGSSAVDKIRTGPMRANTHFRVTSRFDYQPDVCKDYKGNIQHIIYF
jgi:RING finger protein 113A